jgi:hypothetical protein
LPHGDFQTLTITAALPPSPALKYQLFVDPAEQTDGNAAPIYLQALLGLPDQATLDAMDAIDELKSDADFAREMTQKYPSFDTSIPRDIELATRRDKCDWGLPITLDGLSMQIRSFSGFAAMTKCLRYKLRITIAHDDIEQSTRLLQAMSVMADRIDTGKTFLINNLISVDIESNAIEGVQRLMERPKSPNLYWALRQLPAPFGHAKTCVDTDRSLLLNTFPALGKARLGQVLSTDELQSLTSGVVQYFCTYGLAFAHRPPLTSLEKTTITAAFVALNLGTARDHFAATRHLTSEQVLKVNPMVVVCTFLFDTYQEASDAACRWTALPYPQALPGLQSELDRVKALAPKQTEDVFVNTFLLQSAIQRNARLDQTIAATATVEALRAYAASHDNRFPPALSDMTETPPPNNPATGQPFHYTRTTDTTAILQDDAPNLHYPLNYTLQLRP